MEIFTEIGKDRLKDGDVVYLVINTNGIDEKYVTKYKDEKFYNVFDDKYIIFHEGAIITMLARINYRFVSDGTWFIENTDVFPISVWGKDENSNPTEGIFKGFTVDDENKEILLPRLDEEMCSFDEFKITKR